QVAEPVADGTTQPAPSDAEIEELEFLSGALGYDDLLSDEEIRVDDETADGIDRRCFEREQELVAEEIAHLTMLVEEAQIREREIPRAIASLEDQLIEESATHRVRAAKAQATSAQLSARRATYPLRIFAERGRLGAEVSAAMAREFAAGAEQLLEAERRIHAVHLERKQLHEEEWNRRTGLLRNWQDEAAEHLRQVQIQLDRLREWGFSEPTSRFLTAVAAAGFVATGWLFGRALDLRDPGPESLFAIATDSLASALKALVSGFGLPQGLIVLLVVPLLLAAILVGALGFINRWIKVLDQKFWTKRDVGRVRDLRWWRLPKEPLSRRSYAQLLAQLPLLLFLAYGVLVTALVFSLSDRTAADVSLASYQALVHLYIGLAVAALFVAVGVIYVIEVVGVMKGPEMSSRRRRPTEIVVVAALLVGVFGVLDWVFTVDKLPLLVGGNLVGTTLLMTANGLIGGFGFTYRGLFDLRASLQADMQRLEEEIQGYSGVGVPQWYEPLEEGFRDRVRSTQQELDRQWTRLEEKGSRVVTIPTRRGRTRWLLRLLRRTPEDPGPWVEWETHYADALLEPELLGLMADDFAAVAESDAAIADLRARIAELRRRSEHPESLAISHQRARRGREIDRMEQSFHDRSARRKRTSRAIQVARRSAHELGHRLAVVANTRKPPRLEE
ncbi:MAG TPA: hypothetical protein VEK15_05930, partial [Vicinamibacteria bacterium]|nr:hypothetical protein [Vicinamibacteria bacterium]